VTSICNYGLSVFSNNNHWIGVLGRMRRAAR